MLRGLKSRLKGKVVVLGIGNTLRSDDGAGSVLAKRIKDNPAFIVFDAGASPENYLEKIISEQPDVILVVDGVDFGCKPGEVRILETGDIKTANLFATHNASISLTIKYLQSRLKADIIILIIQPKCINFGDKLSKEVSDTLVELEDWFNGAGKTKG